MLIDGDFSFHHYANRPLANISAGREFKDFLYFYVIVGHVKVLILCHLVYFVLLLLQSNFML